VRVEGSRRRFPVQVRVRRVHRVTRRGGAAVPRGVGACRKGAPAPARAWGWRGRSHVAVVSYGGRGTAITVAESVRVKRGCHPSPAMGRGEPGLDGVAKLYCGTDPGRVPQGHGLWRACHSRIRQWSGGRRQGRRVCTCEAGPSRTRVARAWHSRGRGRRGSRARGIETCGNGFLAASG
jgi:hypothetical protein